MKKLFRAEGLLSLFTFLVLSMLAASVVLPLLWVLFASVKTDEAFFGHPWSLPDPVDLKNYAEAWREAGMGAYFMNSVTVTALALAVLLITALPCSYVLARFSFRGRKALRTLFATGLFINASYLVVPIFLMLTKADSFFGVSVFLNSRAVVSVVYAACALPFTVYLLSGYLAELPREYEEAAYVDGASRLRTMVQVMLPMAKPGIITAVLFNFLAFWNEYIVAITLLTDDAKKTLPVGLMNLMKAQNAAAEYGRMYAGLVMVMIPTLLLYILLQKKLTEGISPGGVKG